MSSITRLLIVLEVLLLALLAIGSCRWSLRSGKLIVAIALPALLWTGCELATELKRDGGYRRFKAYAHIHPIPKLPD
jgi:hypothetical protein